MSTVKLKEREVPVRQTADVLVVGGGPSGLAAAVAAAKEGCKTILVERYGYLGGMATGGHVLILMDLDSKGKQVIKGFADDLIQSMYKFDPSGIIMPPPEHRGSNLPEHVNQWKDWGMTVSRDDDNPWGDDYVRGRAVVDSEVMKTVADMMVKDAGVDIVYHSLATMPLIEGNVIKGVVFESKSGPWAILADAVIDASGDGDIMANAGVSFELSKSPVPFAITIRMGNIDLEKVRSFERENPTAYEEFSNKIKEEITGFKGSDRIFNLIRPGTVWISTRIGGSPIDITALTKAEFAIREGMWKVLELYKKHIPGCESAYILDTAPQVGIRESRRMIGEYVITKEDIEAEREFEDVVCKGVVYLDYNLSFDIPYRALLPKEVNNLLVTGRPISMTKAGFALTQALMFQCMAVGQASGSAAALAIKSGKSVRDIDVKQLQNNLELQGAYLRDETPSKKPSDGAKQFKSRQLPTELGH